MSVQYRQQVGQSLRRRRDELGLTQAAVADRVEDYLRAQGKLKGTRFDAQNISRWERGANLGTTTNIEAVAHALETTPGELLSQIGKPTPTNGNGPRDAGATEGADPSEIVPLLHETLERLRVLQTSVDDLRLAMAVGEAEAAADEAERAVGLSETDAPPEAADGPSGRQSSRRSSTRRGSS